MLCEMFLKKGSVVKVKNSIKKSLVFSVCSFVIVLNSASICLAKTIKEPIKIIDNYRVSYSAPMQQFMFINNTKQPMSVSFKTGSYFISPVRRNATYDPYVLLRGICNVEQKTTAKPIEPNGQYLFEYSHMSPDITDIILNFSGKGDNLTSWKIDNSVHGAEGVFTIRGNGTSSPTVESN